MNVGIWVLDLEALAGPDLGVSWLCALLLCGCTNARCLVLG